MENKISFRKEILNLVNKNVDVRIINFTHKNCMDGAFSSVVVKKFTRDNSLNLHIYSVDYSDGADLDYYLNKVRENDIVLFTDFSTSKDILDTLAEKTLGVFVIDHHLTAKENLVNLEKAKAVFDLKESGATLTWKVLFPDKEVPTILNYIKDRDIWLWEMENSKEFHAGLRMTEANDIIVDLEVDKYFEDSFITENINKGKLILEYENKEVMRITKKVLNEKGRIKDEVIFCIGNKGFICFNNDYLISEVGNYLSKNTVVERIAQYFIRDGQIIFSLRGSGEGVVNDVAEKFGGGGHPYAAGFSIDLEKFDFEKFFKERKLKGE